MIRAFLLASVVAVAIAAAAPAAAQDGPLASAWEDALGEVDGVIGADDLAEIQIIGYHAAVARRCEGFALDVDDVAAATDGLLADAPPDAAPEALMARQAEILLAVGVAHGLFLAEGALDPDRFCAEAAAARAAAGFDSYWE